ncbi:cytosolic non-specific dipeptidase-like [Brienomyrus brachyistius]|uniref:cytosolic non-specific dipeptidase-like n=1 Tax=Brienomyrus brachyistius TaxID=42636 RepID=UPI0020B248EC|nr:cytosolic non-specific dipeptidase-like [Brienomyrus brachyistius]
MRPTRWTGLAVCRETGDCRPGRCCSCPYKSAIAADVPSSDRGTIRTAVPQHPAPIPPPAVMLWCVLVLSLSWSEVHSFQFEELAQYIDSQQEQYVETLREWIAIESDSSDVQRRADVQRMMNVTAEKLRKMQGKVEMVDVGLQQLPDGTTIPLPKVVAAQIGSDPSKLTVCVYGHVDVQPAKKEDGWATDPYSLTDINGNLYGRGASDNKAPVLAWLHTVEAYQALSIDLPVNVKFIIEGMEETGSNGLDAMVEAHNDTFFSDVDYIIISDCGWLSRRPALTYGTRGNCYFFAEVEGPKKDLHSGVFGGTVIEPMTDLIGILATLISPRGEILIPGIAEAVAPLTDEERAMFHSIEFDMDDYKQKIGVDGLMYNTKEDVLAHRWRHPTVSIHGIEGAFSASGSKTVIPAKVTGKFSIRQVPNMEPKEVEKQVKAHLEDAFAKRGSPNKLKVSMVIGAKPWLADIQHPLYAAGKAAVQRVFQVEPDMIREGGTIPVARTFQDVTGKSIIMLPIGGFDDGLHSQNEKMSRYNYIEGTKLFAAFLHEVSQIKRD